LQQVPGLNIVQTGGVKADARIAGVFVSPADLLG